MTFAFMRLHVTQYTVSSPFIYVIFGKPFFFAVRITDMVYKICDGFIFISLNNEFGGKLVADSVLGQFLKGGSMSQLFFSSTTNE